jgi:hypothetical protein
LMDSLEVLDLKRPIREADIGDNRCNVGSGPEADNSAAAGKPARDVNAIARAADPPNLRKRHLRRLAISK